jgi:DNA-binding FadR family transcriptional regulator
MSAGTEAVEVLRRLLESGRYPSQARLPPERALTQELGLSRRALRSALEVLEAEGRLWRQVGRGTFTGARPPEREEGISLVTAQTSPAELMEVSLWLEPVLARVAATRASRMEIDGLRYLLERSEPIRDPVTWDLWDTRIHRAIAEASHNGLMLSLFDSINAVRDQAAWTRLRSEATTPERFEELRRQHRVIVDAIAAQDPRAAETAMRRHLVSVQEALLLGPEDGAELPELHVPELRMKERIS